MLGENDDLTLYLLRHGESVANTQGVFASRKIDSPLSLMGRQQVERQSKILAPIRFDACYTSPLVRATQSAEILRREAGLQFVQTNALLEVDVGVLDGEPEDVSQNMALYEEVLREWEYGLHTAAFPGGESLQDIQARFASLLEDVKGTNRVLLLGHCLLFMCAIWLFAENHGSTLETGHMGRGNLSLLVKTEGGYRLQEFNQAPPETISSH
ncbi:MAG: histidine phosphatase family protein [bacterium]